MYLSAFFIFYQFWLKERITNKMGRKEPVRERDITKAKKKEVITKVTEYSSKKKKKEKKASWIIFKTATIYLHLQEYFAYIIYFKPDTIPRRQIHYLQSPDQETEEETSFRQLTQHHLTDNQGRHDSYTVWLQSTSS